MQTKQVKQKGRQSSVLEVSKGGDIPHLSPNNQVMAGNNFYFNGNDPLFNPNSYDNLQFQTLNWNEVQRMQEELGKEARKNALIAQNQHLISTKNNASQNTRCGMKWINSCRS